MRFYGAPPSSRYSAASVYWLRQENGQGLSMATRSVVPAGAPLQSTAVITAEGVLAQPPGYDTVFPGADGDHFFASNLRASETLPLTFTLTRPATADATLLLEMQGVTTGRTSCEPRSIRAPSGQLHTWNGATATTFPLPIGRAAARSRHTRAQAQYLRLGRSTLCCSIARGCATRRSSPPPLSQTIFDGVAGARRYSVGGFAAGTALLYDLRDPQRPARLNGATISGGTVAWQDAPTQPGRYALLAPNQTVRPAISADVRSNLALGAADYLIVGYKPFLPAVVPLAAYYRGKGLRVATVDIQDIYDEFGGGELHPEALRGFLRHAYAQWRAPRPPTSCWSATAATTSATASAWAWPTSCRPTWPMSTPG